MNFFLIFFPTSLVAVLHHGIGFLKKTRAKDKVSDYIHSGEIEKCAE